jgi:hypothetical protein
VVSGMVDEARKLIAAMRWDQNEEKQKGRDPALGDNQQAALLLEDGDAPPSSSLKNPPRTKPKGRPKEKEKMTESTNWITWGSKWEEEEAKDGAKETEGAETKKGQQGQKSVHPEARKGLDSARMQVHGSNISKGRR